MHLIEVWKIKQRTFSIQCFFILNEKCIIWTFNCRFTAPSLYVQIIIIYAQRKIISTKLKTHKICINFERTNTIELKKKAHPVKQLFLFLFILCCCQWIWYYYCFSKSLLLVLLFRLMIQSFYWKDSCCELSFLGGCDLRIYTSTFAFILKSFM